MAKSREYIHEEIVGDIDKINKIKKAAKDRELRINGEKVGHVTDVNIFELCILFYLVGEKDPYMLYTFGGEMYKLNKKKISLTIESKTKVATLL